MRNILKWWVSLIPLFSLLIDEINCTASVIDSIEDEEITQLLHPAHRKLRRRLLEQQHTLSLPLVDVRSRLHPVGQGLGCSGSQGPLMDIYISKGSQPAPAVLLLPDGEYDAHVTDTISSAGAEYIQAGYTVAILYYRLPLSMVESESDTVCADPMEAYHDVVSAHTHIYERHKMYNIDRNKIVISGFSAGAHLGAYFGSKCKIRHECPAAQVLHYPYLTIGSKIMCSSIGEKFMEREAEGYEECSPTALADKATPPTIVYHASEDQLVPTSEMTEFVTALMNNGVSHEYYEVPKGGHYLVPFSQVAAASAGTLSSDGNYASLIKRALQLEPSSCVRCSDFPSHAMFFKEGRKCSDPDIVPRLINGEHCVDSTWWSNTGTCRLSCFKNGKGYLGETCCPEPDEEYLEQPCTNCVDILTPTMTKNHITCSESGVIETKCRDDSWWVSHNYCQNSCYQAGRGYDGIECCIVE